MTNPAMKRRWQTPVIKTLLYLLAWLPLRMSRGLARWIGRRLAAGQSRLARVTRTNIAACYPDLGPAAQAQLSRESILETAQTMLEMPAIWVRSYDWLARHIVAVEGRELYDQARARGKGLTLLGPHLGNWEVVGLYLSAIGPITSLYQPPRQQALEDFVRNSREKAGATLVPTNRRGIASLFKTLKANGVVGILPDQEPDPGSGRFADFMGVPAMTMTLVHNLHQRTGCELLMTFAERVPGGFRVHFIAPDPAIYSAEEAEAVAALNRSVAQCVSLAPAQYQWEYKRFKNRPAGLPKLY